MKQVVEHVEKVLKDLKFKIIYEDDLNEQNPMRTNSMAMIEVSGSETEQSDQAFKDVINVGVTISDSSSLRALEKISDVRQAMVSKKTIGVKAVQFTGFTTGENPYIEKMKTYQMTFLITTYTERIWE